MLKTKLLLILRASWRNLWRWARQHLYVILILSPLIIGMTYLTVDRAASNFSGEWEPALVPALTCAVLIQLALVGLSLSRASMELYHVRNQESFLDAMPVTRATQFHTALATRLIRTGAVSLILLVARTLFGGPQPWSIALALALALFVALTVLTEILAALHWIHWGHTRDTRPLFVAAGTLLPAFLLAGWLLLHIVKPVGGTEFFSVWVASLSLLWIVALYLVARRTHHAWRAADIEYAKRIQTTGHWSIFNVRALERLDTRPSVRMQLARDLQLTWRAFSSAVYVAAGVALLWIVALATALTTGWLPPTAGAPGFFEATWHVPVIATKIACVFALAALVVLLPVLVAYQLPHLWLERAAGATGEEMWEAKLWYTRIVSLPAPLVAWGVGVATGQVPWFYVLPLLVECLWLWWMVSTLAGALAYETPAEPGLAIILMTFVSLGLGTLAALLWPFGIAGYGMSIDQLRTRAPQRARYHLIAEED